MSPRWLAALALGAAIVLVVWVWLIPGIVGIISAMRP